MKITIKIGLQGAEFNLTAQELEFLLDRIQDA